jgi:hypothetical protein
MLNWILILSCKFTFIHSSVALQLFVGSWPLLQFRNIFYRAGRIPWANDQPVARPSLHTGQHKQNTRTQTSIDLSGN